MLHDPRFGMCLMQLVKVVHAGLRMEDLAHFARLPGIIRVIFLGSMGLVNNIQIQHEVHIVMCSSLDVK